MERFKRLKEHWQPKMAWSALIGFVAVYDAMCPPRETLSEQMDRWRESGDVADFVVDAMYRHLKRLDPPEEDIIHQLAILCRDYVTFLRRGNS